MEKSLQIRDISKVFYESGIFVDIKSEAQAMVKILAGMEIGLSPIQSMNSCYIVGNKVGYETKIFLAKLKETGKYDYRVKHEFDDKGVAMGCEVEFLWMNASSEFIPIGTSRFDRQDAIRTGLINKDIYKKYPKLMMFYRAASDGIKMFCPQILNGAALYEDYLEVDFKAPSSSGMIKISGGKIDVQEVQ